MPLRGATRHTSQSTDCTAGGDRVLSADALEPAGVASRVPAGCGSGAGQRLLFIAPVDIYPIYRYKYEEVN